MTAETPESVDPEVYELVKELVETLDGDAVDGLTVGDLRTRLPIGDTSQVSIEDIKRTIDTLTNHHLTVLAEDPPQDEARALAMFAVAMAVVFGGDDLTTIELTPRALSQLLNEERRQA